MPSTPAPKGKKPCSYFLKGKCAFGENCSRPHIASSTKETAPRRRQNSSPTIASPKPQYPAASTSILSRNAFNRSPTPPDRDTIEPPAPASRVKAVQAPDVCAFYPLGMCENGDECEFRHEDPPEGPARYEVPTPSTPPPVAKTQACRHYLKGRCREGNSCKFSHSNDGNDSSSEDPPSSNDYSTRNDPIPNREDPKDSFENRGTSSAPSVCNDYLNGRCWEGAACKLSHRMLDNESSYQPSRHARTSSVQTKSSIARRSSPSPAPPSVAAAYRRASPFGHHEVAPSRKAQTLRRPEAPSETDEDEDQFADADDDEEDPSEIEKAIMKTPRVQGRALSPEASTSRRIYPDVRASPKPVPYVTDIVPHWCQFADPKADGTIPFCKQLAQNRCTLREECRFRHSLTIDEYIILFKDQQPNMWTISRSDNAPVHAVSSPPTTTIVSPPPLAPTTTKVVSKAASKRPAVEKKPCNFWTLGKCKNGSKCPFAHIGSPAPPEEPSKSTTICRNLQYDGVCKYGDQCFYSHDLPAASDEQEEEQAQNDEWGATTNENGWGAPTDNTAWEDTPTKQPAAEATDNGWGAAPADGNNGWGSSHDSQRNDYRSGSGSSSSLRPRTRPGSRVCFDYSKGRCHRSNCRFSHDLESNGDGGHHSGRDSAWSGSEVSSIEARRRRGKCHDFSKGWCARGDRCRFSHDGEPAGQEPTANHSSWDEQPADDTVHESWGQPETKVEGDGGGWGDDYQEQPTQAEGAGDGEGGDTWGDTNQGWPSQEDEGEATEDQTQEEEQGIEPGEEPEVETLDESWTEQATEEASGWGEMPTEDGETKKIQKPCKAFGQGACTWGDSCRYLHKLPEDQIQYHPEQKEETSLPEVESHEQVPEIPLDVEAPQQGDGVVTEPEVIESEPEPEDEPADPETSLERFIYHCTVRFNNRCSPTSVMTAADSSKIILSNLPADSTIPEIQTLAGSFGLVKEVSLLGEATDSATVSIEFANPEDSMAAAKQLNDQPFGSRPISAKLDSRAPVFARSPLHSQMLMVSWPGATLIAWAYYPSITIGKAAAAKLDKTMFKDRKIEAVFERPGKKGPYPIRLTGLPPSTTKAELDALCIDPIPNLTTLGEPSYTQSPEEAIRKDLSKYGRIEEFRICPQDDGAFRTVAYVTMQTYTAADEASRTSNKSTPKYLGGAMLKVQHIYLASYKIMPEIFECIRDRIGMIRESHKDACKILEDFDGYTRTVELRASIDESTEFAEVNVELGALIDGSLVLGEDQRPLWDPYLELSSSSKAIDKINDPGSDLPCFVHCDKRLQCIRIYGSEDGQARGKKMLLKILKKVAEQCHEIELERSAHVSGLVTGGFDQLQRSLGENKVSLSIVEAKLTVRGTTEDLAVAKAVVSDLASSASSAPSEPASTHLCPFCKRVPVSPVKLTCRHAYCQACLQFALASTALKRDAIPRSPFFACVAPLRSRGKPQGDTASGNSDNVVTRCSAPLSYFVVRDNLPFSHDSHYLKAVFATSVRASQGRFFFCPTPDCSAVYRSGDEGIVIRCQGCSSDVCPKCSKRAHDGSLCLVE